MVRLLVSGFTENSSDKLSVKYNLNYEREHAYVRPIREDIALTERTVAFQDQGEAATAFVVERLKMREISTVLKVMASFSCSFLCTGWSLPLWEK